MKYEDGDYFFNGSKRTDIVPMSGDDVPSNDNERNLALLPALLYIALMVVLGTLGNAVVCYVYGFKLKVTVTKQFILVLAVLDLANCLICAPTEMVMVFKIVSFDAPIWCKISRFITYSLNGSTSLILLAIAVDRYCKVCRPLKICFNRVRAKRFCSIAIVLSFLMAWPSLVLYGNKTVSVGTGNGTTCLINDDYERTLWPLAFYTVFFLLFLAIAITIIALYTIIARQIRVLRRRQVERISNSPVHKRLSGYVESPEYSEANLTDNEHSKCATDTNSNENFLKVPSPRDGHIKPPSPTDNHLKPGSPRPNVQAKTKNQKRQCQRALSDQTSAETDSIGRYEGKFVMKKLAQALLKELHHRKTAYKPGKSTLMLFLITLLFVLSFLPFFITAMIRGVQGERFFDGISNKAVVVFNIFIRSYLLSNAANPIIYSFCNSKFRQECKKIFCRCLKKENPVEIRVENTDNTMSML